MKIDLHNIVVKYSDPAILNDFSFEFKDRCQYVLTGESGSGKTTVIRTILKLVKPVEGFVSYSKENPVWGVLFQEDRLIDEMSAIGNIRLTSPEISSEKITSELSKVLPADCLNRPVKELSGGMKRRVALVRALIREADAYLLDEPLTGLDEENQQKVIEYIKSRTADKTLIIASHMKVFENFCIEIKL